MNAPERERIEADATAAEADGNNRVDDGDSCEAAELYYRAFELYESLLGDRALAAGSETTAAIDAINRHNFAAATKALNDANVAAAAAAAYLKAVARTKKKAADLLLECADQALERGDLVAALELYGFAITCGSGAGARRAADSEAFARDAFQESERRQDEAVEPPGGK